MGKFKCAHCRLKFDESAMIAGEGGHKFCCRGCKSVYEILRADGLGEFYERLGSRELSPVKAQNFSDRSIRNIYENYVKKEDGFCKIRLALENVHCAACAWLIEKALFSVRGVTQISVNVSSAQALVVWRETAAPKDSNDGEAKILSPNFSKNKSEISGESKDEILNEGSNENAAEISVLAQILERVNSVGYVCSPYEPSREQERADAKRRDFYARLLVGLFCSMNIMWMAVAQWAGYFSGMSQSVKDILNFAQFLLATPALFYTGAPFFAGARAAVRARGANMDLLVVFGACASYFYSVYAMFSRSGETYFDGAAMIITVVFLGKFLETSAAKKIAQKVGSMDLCARESVEVVREGKSARVQALDVKIGDLIALNAGERAIIDGCAAQGRASFDYSSVTGESAPVLLGEGDAVRSGAICLDGRVIYEASATFEDSFLSKISRLLRDASLQKPKIELLADKISAKFALFVLAASICSFCVWSAFAPFSQALSVAVAVAIIACPCALGLATPVAALTALGAGAKRGVIFKRSKIIETLASCDTAIFDKTGTLTKRDLEVKSFENLGAPQNLIYSLALASKHPVSAGVARFLENKNCENFELEEVKEVAAKGVSASFEGSALLAGSAKFMRENGVIGLENFSRANEGLSEYLVAINGKAAARALLGGEIKEGAKECVEFLKRAGFSVLILSGDKKEAVRATASTLGVDEFYYGRLPEDKADFVRNLQKKGRRVLMVGDGINDALALSYADAAVCMGAGADISLAKSDVALLSSDPRSLISAVVLARRTVRAIRQNLFFALGYNALAIPLAALGYVIPLIAAASMSLSSVAVVLNSLRIGAVFKDKK